MRTNKKDKNDMSTQLIAKRRVFDLDAFEKHTVEVKYEQPEQFTSAEQANTFLTSMEADKLVKVVNSLRNRSAMLEAKASVSGASPKLVNQMVNVFRMLPPYSDLIEKDSEGNATKDSRQKQTQAIYAFIKSTPQILEGLKKQALAAAADEDEDDDNDVE